MYNKNAWHKYKNVKPVMDFSEGYKDFLTKAKTERLAVDETVKILKAHGFKEMHSLTKVKTGDKIYIVNRNKNVAAFIIGKKPISEGLHILGAHIDSPRIDLKQNPLYEDTGFAMLDTHYYGGIKKYQWTTLPLALVGVVCKKDGSIININIGLDKKDPIFTINDLLIHLSDKQLQQPAKTIITGENLDITFGSIPLEGAKEEAVKMNVLKLLRDKYHFDEEDFTSAEIEAVPAYEARDCGIDRSMVASYGQDDRSCAYASLMAIATADPKKVTYTSCIILTDKEEVGSIGATGAESYFIENVLLDLVHMHEEKHPTLKTRTAFRNSKMISSDVSAAADPLFKEVNSPHKNMARFGHGVCFNKYSGHRGKSGNSDANPEFIAYLRKILDDNGIDHQSSELGAVDAGGGGTISYALAKYNMDVVDAGVPLLAMHSPLEVVSKVDLYEAYLFYKAFLLNHK